ncbi:MAG: traSA:integrase fusion protein [Ilumatobacteraceae bacterium]|nr:traSA:integrase fusion protein [Ilumatobacteraceae bacterium]
MSSITTIRDKSGRPIKFVARYRTPDGDSRSQVFDKKADAESFISTTEVSKLSGLYVDAQAGRLTFRHYADQWVASQPHRPSTAACVKSIMGKHILPTFGDRQIASIRPSHVQAWVAGLELAPSTVATVYGKLVAIFHAAVEDRVIASSPCRRSIKLPRPGGTEITPMSPADVRSMVLAVNERYRALLIFMAGSGLRPGEACGVTVDRVDFLRRTVRIDRQLVMLASDQTAFGPPKTPSSTRTIPLPQAAIDALAAHLKQFAPGDHGLIFTGKNGLPVRRNALGYVWRTAAKKAKVVDRNPHDRRHYAASVMIDQGSSVKSVQRHLGHASAKTTLDTYAHLWPDNDEVTRRALDAGLLHVVSSPCREGVISEAT